MRQLKRLLALVLVLVMVVGVLPVQTFAEGMSAEEHWEVFDQNPRLAHLNFAEGESNGRNPVMPRTIVSLEEAVAAMQAQMIVRTHEIEVQTLIPNDTSMTAAEVEAYVKNWWRVILYAAMAHDGTPSGGDYLYGHYASAGGTYAYDAGDAAYINVRYKYELYYTTTYAQEQAVTNKVNQVLAEIITDDMTDYEKVKAIYDYIVSVVTYDYAALGDPNDFLAHSAYGALMEGSAVCDGYSMLFYRMCLEVGVDTLMITGVGDGDGDGDFTGEYDGDHAWNVVCIDGYYYNVDVTWDDAYDEAGLDYAYFLKCNETFEVDHIRDAYFTGAEYNEDLPMATRDYQEPCQEHDYETVVKAPTCTQDGYTTYTCSVCGDTYTADPVAATGHRHETVVTPPTCTQDGYTTYTCAGCGDTYTADPVAARHNFTDWYTHEGVTMRSCQVETCGYTEYQNGTKNLTTGQCYATVAAALLEAKYGETVILLADNDEGDEVLLIKSGVKLDLNGYDLTAGYLLGLQDGVVVGTTANSAGEGSKLYVHKDNIILSEAAPASGANYILPVWNGDHFIFSLFNVNTSSGGCGFAVSSDGDSLVLNFQHLASGYVQKNMLYNGGTDNCVSVVVEAAWENDVSSLSQRFVFTDAMVGKVAVGVNGVNYMYKAELTGCSAMRNLVIRALVVTDCGVCVISKTFEI